MTKTGSLSISVFNPSLLKQIARIFLVLMLCHNLFGQITISNPISKAVYQRSADNKADIVISGSYDNDILTSVQARLLKYTDNTVVPGFNWVIIEANPTMGFFQGELKDVPGGWYKLEVRAVKSGTVLNTQSVERVGVGEVFAIAGQSNAQGWHDGNYYQGMDANDERVVAFDNGMYCRDIPLPFPSFTEIKEATKIAPNGKASWLWGQLGKYLVDVLNVPVSFFNYGASGSSTQNWVESSNGIISTHPFTAENFCSLEEENEGEDYGPYEPYNNFKRGLNYYNSIFGVRAVLWHQGESDNYLQVSQTTYKNNLNSIINHSRNDYNDGLPWVISRASYLDLWPASGPYSPVINAQDEVINEGTQVFGGPLTDWLNNNSIAGSRDWQDLHFSNPIGLSIVAEGWNDWLTWSGHGFMENAVPVAAKTPPVISASVLLSGQVKLEVPSGYNTYKWIRTDITGIETYEGTTSVGNTSSVTFPVSGTYLCWVADSKGNLQMSIPVNTNSIFNLTQNGNTCEENVYLSDLKYYEADNNRGPIELNQTPGQEADGDGQSIVLKTTGYSKGIGVHGQSKVNYLLPENSYSKFQAKIGIPDNVSEGCLTGGVYFKLVADGDTLFSSGLIKRNSVLVSVDVNIYGKRVLTLITEEDVFSDCNQAVWADAILKCSTIDDEPPTIPAAFMATDTLTKCITYQWQESTDNVGVTAYELFKDGVLLTTLSVGTLSYRVTGLSAETEYIFSIRAKDAAGNYSEIAYDTISLPSLYVGYLGDDYICTETTYFPTEISIPGGIFKQDSGPAAIVDSLTGEFYSNYEGTFMLNYKVGGNVPACTASQNIGVYTLPKPSAPVITSNATLANRGSTISLLATTTCVFPSSLMWSFSEDLLNPITDNPDTSTVYYAECVRSLCRVKSNEVEVKVLDDCYDELTLKNPDDILSNMILPLQFNSSGLIKASNLIEPSSKIEYNSEKSIVFEPGFTVEPGVVFTAKIKNCP